MNQNKLFRLTRIRLALYYAIVMGLILSLCAFGFYRAVFHAHVVALDSEIESVAGTLHDSIELKLQSPGRLEPLAHQLFPNIDKCGTGASNCIQQQPHSKRHLLGIVTKSSYYIRFFDTSGKLIATAGYYPEGLPDVFNQKTWQFLKDSKGKDYHQITLGLHTQNYQDWGYMQVGRSLQEFNHYLDSVKLVLVLGLLVAMAMIAGASWWLSGLAMQPIYQSYRQIQQFTADAAHELRTPLAATGATVESALLMPQIDSEDTRDILQTIQRQNQRLTALVVDLLMLARLDKQAQKLQREVCCLNDIVSDLVEEFEAMANAAEVKLTSLIQVHQPLNIIGNADQLYRLFSNLIVNAIQYTPKGGEVKVLLDRNDHYAVIKVQDTGIGIPKNELTRIFDRFYRVSSDRSRSTGGSGLGLAIVQAIIQSHHGSIDVQSNLGEGSTFTIKLPFNVPPLDSVRSIYPFKILYR
ncbi:two-component sensor histidine kinase [Nostoc sp. B(2019)]|uniref:histidine kinase n=1 Tax=Nostoc cf. edaphicum LEGE 07299 TaxID=2777974 RepID=A0ABR9U727_9NOSO|nr:two-component system sensor histidine kinase RppB [Nostoc edaphicum]MBE9107625.1 two-component sensor histidine kinase [Nostoc cf. edaphicum LEGE 07299]NDJ24391.1 two-component sensor histidine kinase [Nostoc sp. B(2019)]